LTFPPPDGQATGLTQNSVVGCLFLATVAEDRLTRIGKISPSLMGRIDDCLKAALVLP
jgi:hypothetical protein